MACDILIHRNFRNNALTDIEKDNSSVYKKGYIVTGKPLPHSGWGNQEKFEAGNFVHLRIIDANWEDFEKYTEPWRIKINHTLVSSNLITDSHRFKVYSSNSGSNKYGILTLPKIERYLNRWNVDLVSVVENEIVIDIVIDKMLKSQAYWDYTADKNEGLENLMYTLNSYTKSTGEYTYVIEYTNVRSDIQNRFLVATELNDHFIKRNITVITHDSENQKITVSLFRKDVLNYFKDEVYFDVLNDSLLYKRQYYVTNAVVDFLVNYSENNSGQTYETTKTEFLKYVKSMLDKTSV